MALVWAEPFEEYGGTNALVIQNGYSANAGALVAGQGRTGSYAMQIGAVGPTKRPLDTAVATIGSGVAISPVIGGAGGAGLSFENAGTMQCSIRWNGVNNSVSVLNSASVVVGAGPANKFILGSYVWLETKVIQNSAGVNTGYVEVRINGVVQVIVNGINLPNLFDLVYLNGNTTTVNYDDWIIWDGTGASNNTFMGDRRLFAAFPSANGVQQDFTASAGSAFNCVNVIPPVDTTYIQGAAAGNVSEFAKTAIGIASTDVAAIVVMGRMFKTDAGVASGRLGIDSAGNVVNSAEIFPGTTGAWYRAIIELNPNGNVPWTKIAADAANIVVTRVS